MQKRLFESIKLVTFDITGTLLQLCKKPELIYADIAAEHGVKVLEPSRLTESFKQEWKRLNAERPCYSPCSRSWWKEIFVNTLMNSGVPPGTTRERLGAIAINSMPRFATTEFWRTQHFAKELLEVLRAKENVHVGIISNFDPRLHSILAATQLSPYLAFVITSHAAGVCKPDPKIFQIAFNLGKALDPSLRAQDVLHVGDDLELDCIGASNAGWNACLVPKDLEKRESESVTLDNGKMCRVLSLESLCRQF